MDAPETRSDQARQPQEYGLEVLCASWNPVAAVAAEPVRACRSLLADLSSVDVDTFLRQFYRCQTS
ncbi:MAG: hypothetical protein KIT18_07975 [Burkholderiales bacterium]|nr:hypothetical protein [Burkholderiales bacterium]